MREALEAGIRFFQYRAKQASRRAVYEQCLKLAALAREAGAVFIVNDHADIAMAAGADGVHLGQDDIPLREARSVVGTGRIIGISTHNTAQALEAQAGGADYIGFGPVYSTSTKDAGPAQGVEAVAAVVRTVRIPVVAIGGINRTNAADVIRAGAAGVAVISAVLSAPDLGRAAADIVMVTGS